MKDTFKPLEALLTALLQFPKGASQEDVILHVKPDSASNEKSLKQAFYNAKNSGLIYAKTEHGERYWHLTEKGKAREQGKELQIGKKVEKITQADIDKTIAQFSDITPSSTPPVITKTPRAPRKDFGATFNTDGKLIIWNGQDEVVFNPTDAAKVIAFVANQMPWVEYVKQHGVKA